MGAALDEHERYLLGLAEAKADMTLHEAREQLRENHGIRVAVPAVRGFFRKYRNTFKKKTGRAKKPQRPDAII